MKPAGRLPLRSDEADKLMPLVREYGAAARKEGSYLAQQNLEQFIFWTGRADAAYFDIIKLVRGDYAELRAPAGGTEGSTGVVPTDAGITQPVPEHTEGRHS